MNFGRLRSEANNKFGDDQNKQGIAARAIDFTEEWANMTKYSGRPSSLAERRKQKRECSAFVKKKLYAAREEEYGFVGTLLTAVVFQVLVQVIVKWIMNKFFD